MKFSIQGELRIHRFCNTEEVYQLALKDEEKKWTIFSKGIEEQEEAHHLPHGVVLIMEETSHPKELKRKNILYKIT